MDPRPAQLDVIKAVSTIRKYIEELDDPIAQKTEAHLAFFNMNIRLDRTRCMKNTLLTDFFSKS